MDAFYAAIEQRDDPGLRGKPIIVGGNGSRGVVAAASYEVRRYGVRSAQSVIRARELCPQVICVTPRMAVYKAVSKEIFEIFRGITPLVEGLSLDEAYLDVTAQASDLNIASGIAQDIKHTITKRTRLTASVGVAPNKLLAKIASDLNKPNGLRVIHVHEITQCLDPLSVRRLPGLGRKTGLKVEQLGIKTLGQLRTASDAQLWPIFGRYSQRMRERAAGCDDRPVSNLRADKSISAEDTFSVDIHDAAQLRYEITQLAQRTCQRLNNKHYMTHCVSIKIRTSDFTTVTRRKTIAPATCEFTTIRNVALELLTEWLSLHPQARLRLLGVGVSQLSPASQLALFVNS